MHQEFIPPQLAKPARTLPREFGWVFQEKFDGHRAQISLRRGTPTIFSRNGHDRTRLFGSLVPSLRQLPASDLVIDGEICVLDECGRSDFARLCASLALGGSFHLVAFDILAIDGVDLTGLPLIERQTLLKEIVGRGSTQLSAAETHSDGTEALRLVASKGGEGVVAKRAIAPYQPGVRSDDWKKIKLLSRQEFVVVGWHEDAVGTMQSLVLATSCGDEFEFRGCVGTGFSRQQREELRDLMTARRADAPFSRSGGIRSDVRWTAPRLVAEIEYAAISTGGILRHPRFVGLRPDKDATEVVLER